MKKCMGMIMLVGFVVNMNGQTEQEINDMKWTDDAGLFVSMKNDSNYILNIDELFHSNASKEITKKDGYTYYPAALGENFIDQLKQRNISIDTSDFGNYNEVPAKNSTLWSALNSSLGGGWVHFINCLLYSLESQQLSLTAPLMKRPESSWKPKPMTETYKRTRKWGYYTPVSQKQAIKEYEIRLKDGALGDLENIPEQYINLFLNTSDKEYIQMKKDREYKKLAQIDLVKLILGANYLGIPQINYVKSMVLKSVLNYSRRQDVPSIIVFDDMDAAVALMLDEYGYHIEKVVFKNEDRLSYKQKEEQLLVLSTIVAGINEVNKRLFEQRLMNYYN